MTLYGFNSFEELLAYNCSPVLMGIKAANLLCLRMEDLQEVDAAIEKYNSEFADKGIVFRRMFFCDKRILLLVFNKSMLKNILKDKGFRAFLIANNYPEKANLEQDLAVLEKHLKEYKEFPHEIGVFLGYPLEDVLGFIIHHGSRCKYSGYWKVYGDVQKAKKVFANYEQSREYIFNKLSTGLSLSKAIADI